MTVDEKALETLIAKEEIRELASLYSRAIDRQDTALLRSLYTKDGTDWHGKYFKGTADEYVQYLEQGNPYIRYTGCHMSNHLIWVDGDKGEGEVYGLAYHIIPDGKGGLVEDLMTVRYLDQYRKENGRWRFADRTVSFDYQSVKPIPTPEDDKPVPANDLSYTVLKNPLFARGARA